MIRETADDIRILRINGGRLDTVKIGSKAELGNVAATSDQYFQFKYEPLEVYSIEYDLKESKRFNERPHVLVDTYLSNDTGSEQTLTYELDEKTTTTWHWEYQIGVEVGAEASGKGRCKCTPGKV